jgi:hypothetical protein
MAKTVNLRSFKQKLRHHRKRFKRFLSTLEKKSYRGLQTIVEKLDEEVWKETDCLTCGNCCKTMTPTFTGKDIKRISAHLKMSPKAFREKWLHYDKKDKDWMNTAQPCQFLNLKDYKCSIYEVRPADCAGFPHHTKKKFTDYIHVYKQNLDYCPATYRLIEKMMSAVKQ